MPRVLKLVSVDGRLGVVLDVPVDAELSSVSIYTDCEVEALRRDERRRCAAEIRAMNAARTDHEWVRESLWHKIIDRAATHIEPKTR